MTERARRKFFSTATGGSCAVRPSSPPSFPPFRSLLPLSSSIVSTRTRQPRPFSLPAQTILSPLLFLPHFAHLPTCVAAERVGASSTHVLCSRSDDLPRRTCLPPIACFPPLLTFRASLLACVGVTWRSSAAWRRDVPTPSNLARAYRSTGVHGTNGSWATCSCTASSSRPAQKHQRCVMMRASIHARTPLQRRSYLSSRQA